MFVYVDTSAIVPLIKAEPHSRAIVAYMEDLISEGHVLITGRITETELRRVAHRWEVPQQQITELLDSFAITDITPATFRLAGTFTSQQLGSLDALHIAAALLSECTAIISFDKILVAAASDLGIPPLDVFRPAENVTATGR